MLTAVLFVTVFAVLPSPTSTLSDLVTFEADLDYAPKTVYRFNRTNFENCLFSQIEKKVTCMVKKDFKKVKNKWAFNPTEIQYVSVNCMHQTYYANRKNICVCVNESDAANPGKYVQHDVTHYCHLRSVGKGMFSKLSEVVVLDLSNNMIEEVEKESFVGLNSLKFLDISNNPVRKLSVKFVCDVPLLEAVKMRNISLDSKTFHQKPFDCPFAMERLTYIDLSDNKIEFVPNHILEKIPNIKTLVLRGNRINYVSETAFMGANMLQYLDLSVNHLKAVPLTLCRFLPGLKLLNLSSNHMTSFDMGELSQCENMKVLDVSLNMILQLNGSGVGLGNLEEFNGSGNGLIKIGGNVFQNASKCSDLDLSMNDLRHLSSRPFQSMKSLKTLKVNGNKFNSTSNFRDIFNFTKHIEFLNLSSNQISEIENDTFRNTNKMKELDLSSNKISALYNASLSGLSSLSKLVLHNNGIRHISESAFHSLSSIRDIDLSHNDIGNHIDSVSMPLSLTRVNLEGNSIGTFPTCFNNSNVKTLNLRSNVIVTMLNLRPNILYSLQWLDMSYNQLESFDNLTFANMPALSELDMSFNVLYGPLFGETFMGTKNLTILNLKKNFINDVDDFFSNSWTSPIKYLDLSFNSIGTIESMILKSYIIGMNQSNYLLRELNLEHSFIHEIKEDAFTGFLNLRQVNLRENQLKTIPPFFTEYKTEFLLQDNPLVCDCKMAWLADSFVTINSKNVSTFDFEVDKCIVQPQNVVLPVRKVPKDHFRCEVNKGCDNTCKCFTNGNYSNVDVTVCHGLIGTLPTLLSRTTKILYFDGNRIPVLTLPNHYSPDFLTKELYMNRSQIGFIDDIFFSSFGDLEILDLSLNQIKTLPDSIFSNLKRLHVLDLSFNKIEVLSPMWFEGLSLRTLKLNGNKIQYITKHVLSVFEGIRSMRIIHLHDNPFECNCKNIYFRHWMAKNKKLLQLPFALECYDTEYPMIGTSLSKFTCLSKGKEHKNGKIIAIIVLLVCLIAATAAVMYYRRDLLAVLYVKLGIGCLRTKYETKKPYDAYLVYDFHDTKCSEWVNGSLLTFLQKRKHPYKIVTSDKSKHLSNFDDIDRTQLQESKCCVFVLNNTVMSNSWCVESFHRAWDIARKDFKFKLIMVVFGDIEINLLEQEMRVMLSEGQYITARSHTVWDRLIYDLPNPEKVFHSDRCDDDASDNDVIIFSATTNNTDDYGSVSIH